MEVYKCVCSQCDGKFTTVKYPSDALPSIFCPYCAAEVNQYDVKKYTKSTDWNVFKRFYDS